jgi:hypothetical protein
VLELVLLGRAEALREEEEAVEEEAVETDGRAGQRLDLLVKLEKAVACARFARR